MLTMLDQLEQIYGAERLEELDLEDAVLVVSLRETNGPRGLSGLHWASTCETFHSQIGLVELGKISMLAAMRDSDMRGE